MKLLLGLGAFLAAWWLLWVVFFPWALHIGARSTPLLYWQGTGTVVSKDGKTYPLYVTFWPGRPTGFSGGGSREGKRWSANIAGSGWLCTAPGTEEYMTISGTMYGGYTSSADSLFEFRLLEWRQPFTTAPPSRGFFDVAGMWHGDQLVMDRPKEQGIQFKSGVFIDHATVTLHWADRADFDAACHAIASSPPIPSH
jgi:hypothetical protein